eukprot:2579535-Amphidinium_carterae.2
MSRSRDSLSTSNSHRMSRHYTLQQHRSTFVQMVHQKDAVLGESNASYNRFHGEYQMAEQARHHLVTKVGPNLGVKEISAGRESTCKDFAGGAC